MKVSRNKDVSALDLMNRLAKDPEWARQDARRREEKEALESDLRREEVPLIDDLAKVNVIVGSVWDLVNDKRPYPGAIPVLVGHLGRRYSIPIVEGIARALTVPEARGIANAAILEGLWRSAGTSDSRVRWALANAVSAIASPGDQEEIERLMVDDRLSDVRHLLLVGLNRAARPN
jgi:hypothetical protein